MKKLLIFWVILFGTTGAFAADFSVYEAGYPHIRDANVNITHVKDVIVRRGAYIEHNLNLSVSYDFESWFFKNYTELEFQWKFTLPEEAIVHDLKFWYNDSLIQARIMDRWTAELLFSEVSSRYREPAILTRGKADANGNVPYEMRVFPITRGKAQKFFIQYLVPARPTGGHLRTWLPLPQITGTPRGADSLEIDVRTDPVVDETPYLIGAPGVTFQKDVTDSLYRAVLPTYANQFVELVLPSPVTGSFFMTTFSDSTGHYYQMAVLPPEMPISRTPRNWLILIDYSVTNTSGMTSDLLFSSLKESMMQALSPQDSVNLIVAYADIVQASTHWLAGTAANLDTIFARCTGWPFLHFNSSQELFAAGTQFLKKQATPGEVVWITNRIDLPTTTAGGQAYAREIESHFPAGTKFHILDLDNVSRLRYTEDHGYMIETFPFLSALTRDTGGNLFFLRFHSLKNIFDALFFEKVSHYQEVEVQVRFQNGYSYNKQLFSLFRGYYPLDFPVIQTGRFEGTFPADVTVIGRTADTLALRTFQVQASDVFPGSGQIATAWFGHHLQELAHKSQSSWMVDNMIDLSVRSRVLTAYTAFLVPNPEAEAYYKQLQQAQNNNDRYNQPGTGVEGNGRLPDQLFLLEAYPNPFNPATTLKIQIPLKLRHQRVVLRIFNVLGQQVRQWRLAVPQSGTVEIVWNATDDWGHMVPSGTYFVVVQVKNQVKRLKILLLR
ncbi:MAG: T9SS type A sorting domain-containing protein [Calditrichaeota bacterium]|nr:T9SS type A sorting domain-containing protein [Calditrichota bacterium]